MSQRFPSVKQILKHLKFTKYMMNFKIKRMLLKHFPEVKIFDPFFVC
jgi:hypothetical protein